jgi:hypothetical protein
MTRARTTLMWLTVAVAWGSMFYATAKAREFVVILGASMARSLPPEAEYRITRVENLQELPTVRTGGRFHKAGNRQRIEWQQAGQRVVVEWEVVRGKGLLIRPSGEPILVRAVESKHTPQQGMIFHMRRMMYPLGYYLILRDAGGETLGVWELLWHT